MKPITKITQVPSAFASLAAKVNELITIVRPIKAGEGIIATPSESHTLLSVDRNFVTEEASASGAAQLPFQVSLFNDATPSCKISANSRLYTSLGTSATTITSLTSEITLAANTYVWLQCTVSSLAVTASAIVTGTAWPTLIVTSGSPAAQTQFNVPIGKVTASAPTAPGFEFVLTGTAYHFEQCLFSHLLTENRASGVTPILYAFPWSGA